MLLNLESGLGVARPEPTFPGFASQVNVSDIQ